MARVGQWCCCGGECVSVVLLVSFCLPLAASLSALLCLGRRTAHAGAVSRLARTGKTQKGQTLAEKEGGKKGDRHSRGEGRCCWANAGKRRTISPVLFFNIAMLRLLSSAVFFFATDALLSCLHGRCMLWAAAVREECLSMRSIACANRCTHSTCAMRIVHSGHSLPLPPCRFAIGSS